MVLIKKILSKKKKKKFHGISCCEPNSILKAGIEK